MTSSRYRRHPIRAQQDDSGNSLASIIGLVVMLLALLFLFDRKQFWATVDHVVFPALFLLFIALGAIALFFRVRHKHGEKRLAELLRQIEDKKLDQEVANFIDGFGSNADGDDPWVPTAGSYTFNRIQLRWFRDRLAHEGVALSTRTDDDITAILEHYIDEKEERFLTERVTSHVQHGFSELNKTGDDFERLVTRLYEAMGYAAKRIGGVGDQGGDVIASKGGENILIQAKFYGGAVGNAAVQQAVGARPLYNCTRAAVVTSSSFTSEAVALAQSNSVELIDGARLKQMLAEHLHEAWH
jgi:Restriction endonuclease